MQYVVKFDKFSGVSEKLKEADPPLDIFMFKWNQKRHPSVPG